LSSLKTCSSTMRFLMVSRTSVGELPSLPRFFRILECHLNFILCCHDHNKNKLFSVCNNNCFVIFFIKHRAYPHKTFFTMFKVQLL
jgi:hypothetical protein